MRYSGEDADVAPQSHAALRSRTPACYNRNKVAVVSEAPAAFQQLIATLDGELRAGRSPAPVLEEADTDMLYSAVKTMLVVDETKAYARSAIAITPEFGLLALSWNARAVSGVHDHAGSGCWVKMLRGSLVETRYVHENDEDSFRLVKSTKMASGSVSYIDDNIGLHDMRNLADECAVSLHCYVPAIEACRVWDKDKMEEIQQAVWRGKAAMKTMTYDNEKSLV